jgi:hypothetical protein
MAAVLKTDQGPISRSPIAPSFAVFGRKPLHRYSVLTRPDLPFDDTITAQFAAQLGSGLG